jgi:copper transport protein
LRRLARLVRIAAVVGALACAFAEPLPAFAHASLIEAQPADGTVVAAPPTSMRLRFNEPVTALLVRLIGSGGDAGPVAVRVLGDTVEVKFPSGLGRGGYALSYRVISADGHPIGGAVTFSVGEAAAAPVLGAERSAAVAGLFCRD